MPSPTRRRPTPRDMEQASLSLRHPDLEDAVWRFCRHPDAAFRLSLAREIAQTRGRELTLAYRNVVMVAAGWRQRRTRAGTSWHRREPCVVFVVRRKWEPGQGGDDVQHLPRHLLIGAEADGRRELYAVPTDVQLAERFAGMACGATAVHVSDPARPAVGTVTCAVRVQRPRAAAADMLLSAMHVFTPFPEINTGPSSQAAAVRPAHDATAGSVAASSPTLRGRLLRDDFSFDAQLADIVDRDWARRSLGDLRLSSLRPSPADATELDRLVADKARFTLLAADNHPAHGRLSIDLAFRTGELSALPLGYTVRLSRLGGATDPDAPTGTVGIRHWQLLQFEVKGTQGPQPGDSGSPVVARTADADAPLVLVGMFIAGSADRRQVYVLPSWQLFDPFNWNASRRRIDSLAPIRL